MQNFGGKKKASFCRAERDAAHRSPPSMEGGDLRAAENAYFCRTERDAAQRSTYAAQRSPPRQGLEEVNKKQHRMISEFLHKPFVSLSLCGDGIPYSCDRKAGVDVWTLSLPGLKEKKHRDIRIPLTGVPHHFMTRESQDDLLSVLAWSFKALAAGKYPTSRADGSPWTGLRP